MIKPKKTASYYLLVTSIMALIIVGTTLAFAIYQSFTKTQIAENQTTLVKPFDGQLKPNLWQDLANRREFRQNELSQVLVNTAVLPTNTASNPAAINLTQPESLSASATADTI